MLNQSQIRQKKSQKKRNLAEKILRRYNLESFLSGGNLRNHQTIFFYTIMEIRAKKPYNGESAGLYCTKTAESNISSKGKVENGLYGKQVVNTINGEI